MNSRIMLTVTSLLSLLLIMAHLTHDTLLQVVGAVEYPIPVVIFTVWLYGTLMLPDRVPGYVIMFLGGLFSAAMIVVHAKGIAVQKTGGFYFVWTLFALSTTGWFTMILAARGMWLALRARRSASLAS
jgi:hypothetical protein